MATARWQRFERLAEKIMQGLAPHAEVTWDDRIVGQDSETERQIDVSVKWADDEEAYLLIIDAKDWSKPADVGDVEKFAGLVKDVRGSRGILVCNAGFTKQAHVYAKNLGLGLCNLHDAESRDWSRDLTIPIVWVELTPQISYSAQMWLDAGDEVQDDDTFALVLSVNDGSPEVLGSSFVKLKVLDSFAQAWNVGAIPRTVGSVHGVYDKRPLRMLVRDSSGVMRWRPVDEFALNYTVERGAWLGQFSPSQCRGLIDCLDERAFIASYLPIGEIPASRDESWEAIDDPTQVALSIRGTVVTTSRIQILDASTGKTHKVDFELIEATESNPSGNDK